MRIVYIIEGLVSPAGMERVLAIKSNYLAEVARQEVFIISLRPLPEKMFFAFSEHIQILSLNIPASARRCFFSTHLLREALGGALRRLHADIVISMGGPESHFLPKIQDGSKKILEFHFSKNYLTHLINGSASLKYKFLHHLKAQVIQISERYSARKFDRLVLLTEADRKLWGTRYSQSIAIPNPLSFYSRESAPLVRKQILAIGRFIAQKGFDLLLESFSLLAKQYPDWTLLLVGEGQEETHLRELTQNYGLWEQVEFKKPTPAIRELLLESSILAFPSRYEGFGLVLTEAMECGVPCVAFDCECGPREIICEGEDGFLVEPFSVEIFADRLAHLMNDPALRRKMGNCARQNVKRFYPEAVMPQWMTLFEELLSSEYQ